MVYHGIENVGIVGMVGFIPFVLRMKISQDQKVGGRIRRKFFR
jgi:L-serine deaminase